MDFNVSLISDLCTDGTTTSPVLSFSLSSNHFFLLHHLTLYEGSIYLQIAHSLLSYTSKPLSACVAHTIFCSLVFFKMCFCTNLG